MRHPTYKHLEAQLRLGSFSLGQWAQITAAGAAAAVFGVYVSPFPTSVTIFVSIVGAGLPVAAVLRRDGARVLGRRSSPAAAWRYWREPRRYLPGAGRAARRLRRPAAEPRARRSRRVASAAAGASGEPLWDV